jgi:hypothetical protein
MMQSNFGVAIVSALIGVSVIACSSRAPSSNLGEGYRSPTVRVRGPRYAHLPTPICSRQLDRHAEHSCWSVEPSKGDRFITVSASCGITDQGSIECWKTALASPPKGRFEAIDDNGWNACATRSEGGAGCWGRAPWTTVPRTDKFTVIVAGGSGPGNSDSEGINACALTELGDIECWGDGSPHWNGSLHIDGPFRAIDLGSGDVVALRSSGELDSFIGPNISDKATHAGPYVLFSANGHVDCQQHATGKLECQGGLRKAAETPPADLANVILLRTGSDHACALQANGDVRCWGDARPPPHLRFSYISQPDMWDSYCGITMEGEAYCWGSASAGSK